MVYAVQAKYGQAEPMLKRAVAILEKALGPEHLRLAQGLHQLGWLHYRKGNYAQAQPFYERALAIREVTLDPEHPEVGRSLSDLGALCGVQGKYEAAEPMLRRAAEILERSLGSQHPDLTDRRIAMASDKSWTPSTDGCDIRLPKPSLKGKLTLEEAIARRRSVREFADHPLSLEEVGQLLWATKGITGHASYLRAHPSAGGLHPLEVYVLDADGVFHYEPEKHRLRPVREGDLRGDLAKAAHRQWFITDAVCVRISPIVSVRHRHHGRLCADDRQVRGPGTHAVRSHGCRARRAERPASGGGAGPGGGAGGRL